jgi:MarR family transcriptional regulator for hemolysin
MTLHNVSMLAELSDSPSMLMADIARRMRYMFDARTRPLGVTRPQWRVLIILAVRPPPSQSELAELLDVERITLCRMVDRLVEASMVERRADPNDRRVWRIHLTQKAMPLVDQLNTIAGDFEKDLLAVLSDDERSQLGTLLGRVRDHLRATDDAPRDMQKAVGQ